MGRTVDRHDKTLVLNDGRKLGYLDVGDPRGTPVIHFHGTPGCRLDVLFAEKFAAQNGIRFIGTDRPGMGLSDFQPGRRLLDWPDDIIQLADALGFDRFAVQGVSGGGPYALACAYKIPERLTACGVIVGMGPHYLTTKGMHFANRLIFFISRYMPWATALMLRKSATRSQNLDLMLAELSENLDKNFHKHDADALRDPERLRIFAMGAKEAFRQGARGIAYESGIFMKPWGFDLEDITFENIHLWHGALDRNVPIETARYMAEKIPNCKANFFDEDGHYSLPLNNLEDIISLMSSFDNSRKEVLMDLKEERNMILDMVAEGKITVEEAKELLDALEKSVKEKEADDDFFVTPNVEFHMPKMPDIPRIVNRATRHAYRRAMKIPKTFYDMDDLADIRDDLEDEVERLREEMESLKEEAMRLREEEERLRQEKEEWEE